MLKTHWHHLAKRRQKQFLLLLTLTVIASLSEIISIGAMLPFLDILTIPEQVSLVQSVIQILVLTKPNSLFITAALLVGVICLSGGQRQRIGIVRVLHK